jgi:uncharacterized membrane protein
MQIKTNRIESIDVLRGLVMIIMALDHTRDYFHYSAFLGDPTNMETTTPFLFFTRFITNFCAPVFVFLAGTSAFLYGTNKSKPELSKFLLTRGLWLILLEITLNNLLWTFDLTHEILIFQVIWAIGFSMVCLSFLIYLPKKALLSIGIILVAGHNLLDGIVFEGTSFKSVIWYLLHQQQRLPLYPFKLAVFHYPVIPWIGLMILGYCFGTFYTKKFEVSIRKKWLLILGISSIALFFILRGINVYGNLLPWSVQKNTTFTILSFFNVTKYPPSLAYLLITMGPSLLFLYAIENYKNRATNFLLVFGRVPLYFYFVHVFVIHAFAIIGILIFGGNWHDLIGKGSGWSSNLVNYGYSLFIVYVVWMSIVILLYPSCKKYMIYKANNKDKWWLSYL